MGAGLELHRAPALRLRRRHTAFETFRLDRLTEPREYARFMLLLSADNLLSGRTRELLEDSRREDRDITDSCVSGLQGLRHTLIAAVRAADTGH